MSTPKVKTSEEYVKTGGLLCPVCGGSTLESTSAMQVDDGVAWQEIVCVDCESTWTDTYTLDGYSNLENNK